MQSPVFVTFAAIFGLLIAPSFSQAQAPSLTSEILQMVDLEAKMQTNLSASQNLTDDGKRSDLASQFQQLEASYRPLAKRFSQLTGSALEEELLALAGQMQALIAQPASDQNRTRYNHLAQAYAKVKDRILSLTPDQPVEEEAQSESANQSPSVQPLEVNQSSYVPFVYEAQTGERFYSSGGFAFNASKPVSYWREHPEKNTLTEFGYYGGDITEKRVAKVRNWNTAGSLDEKWNSWRSAYSNNAKTALAQVRNELIQIKQRFEDPSYSEEVPWGRGAPVRPKEALPDMAFLNWWFSTDASRAHPELVTDLLANNEERYFVEAVAGASLAVASWRTPAWIVELMQYSGSMGPITEAMTKPELIGDEGLAERMMATEEFRKYFYWYYLGYLLPQEDSVQVGGRVRKIITANLVQEHGPNSFLEEGGALPHWIKERPDIVGYAIGNIKLNSHVQENIINLVLTMPESAAHPEWLEYVLAQPDSSNFLELHLNQLLALDHWYNHPVLRQLLNGSPPTVAALRAKIPWSIGSQAIGGAAVPEAPAPKGQAVNMPFSVEPMFECIRRLMNP